MPEICTPERNLFRLKKVTAAQHPARKKNAGYRKDTGQQRMQTSQFHYNNSEYLMENTTAAFTMLMEKNATIHWRWENDNSIHCTQSMHYKF